MYFEDMTPAEQAAYAQRVIAEEAGSMIGFKVITDEGKYRSAVPRERAAERLLWMWQAGDDVEFWGFTPQD